jgi:lipopolysaccharide heptosyltransferase II
VSAPVVAVRLRALGDLTLCTAAFHSLAEGHPGREVHVVTESRFAPLLEGQHGIARVWPIERTTGSVFHVLRALRALRPALAVDFFGNPRSAVIARLSGAKQVWGFDVRGRARAYHHTVPRVAHQGEERREYAAVSLLRLARAAGGADVPARPCLELTERARSAGAGALARAGVTEPGRTIGLVPAGSWPTKTWPLSHVAVLAARLVEAGHPVVAIGGPGEEGVLARLAALAPGARTLRAPDVAALAGVIAGLAAVVGTDSGPRHLAAALGVPTFAWFGPTHPDTWNPPGDRHGFVRTELPCRACDRTQCPHWSCMPGLDPERVSLRVLDHLARHGSASALGTAARA